MAALQVKMPAWERALAADAAKGQARQLSFNFNRVGARRLIERGGGDAAGTVSMMGQASLQADAMRRSGVDSFGQALRTAGEHQHMWRCTFMGEQTIDAGGPYRESVEDCCAELEEADAQTTGHREVPLLPVLVRAPSATEVSFLLHPLIGPCGPAGGELTAAQRTQRRMLRLLGQLMGLAIRTKMPLPLNLAPLVWKQLVQQEVDVSDLRQVRLLPIAHQRPAPAAGLSTSAC
jgi:hypothetical protein